MLVMQCYDINSLSVANLIEVLSRSTDPTLSIPSANRRKKKNGDEVDEGTEASQPHALLLLMLCCVFCSVFEGLGTFLALSSLVSIASSCPLPIPESRLYLPRDLKHFYFYEIIPTG